MDKEKFLDKVYETAAGYFDRGEFFCSEAVLQTINDLLGQPQDPEIVKLASAFPVGLGQAQCLCGAVSGGEMALGLVYGRVHGQAMNPKLFPLAKELHDYIIEDYGATCCRIITREWKGDNFKSEGRKKHCVDITGKVARWVAEKLLEDGSLDLDSLNE